MLPLLCLLVGIALPLVAAGVLLRRGLRPLAAATAYRNAAWRLGLDVDTRGLSLRGRVDGRRLFVGAALDEGRPRIRAVLDLGFPLGLGLVLRRRSERRLRLRRPRVQVVTGDAAFDRAFEIRAFDPDRAARLLTAPVRTAFGALARHHPDLELTDRWVRLSLRRHPPSDRWLLDLVDRLVNLVLAVEQAREAVPPDPRLAPVAEAWAPLAESIGCQLLPSLPALRGTFGGRALTLQAVHYADAPHAELRLARAPSSAGLHVEPRVAGPVGQDLRLGDPDFDEAFVVKGRDAAAAARELGPEARRCLLALRSLGDVFVDEERLWLPEAPVAPEALAGRLTAARAAVEALDAGR